MDLNAIADRWEKEVAQLRAQLSECQLANRALQAAVAEAQKECEEMKGNDQRWPYWRQRSAEMTDAWRTVRDERDAALAKLDSMTVDLGEAIKARDNFKLLYEKMFEPNPHLAMVPNSPDTQQLEIARLRGVMGKAIEALRDGDGTSAECDATYILDDALNAESEKE